MAKKNWIECIKTLQSAYNNKPVGIDEQVLRGSVKQIEDEVDEFHRDLLIPLQAVDKVNKDVELEYKEVVRDTCVDVIFYTLQLAFRAGVLDDLDGDFRKIFEDNMKKVHNSLEDAEKTLKMYQEKGERVVIEVNENGQFVVKDSDGKVRKPWNYRKFSLKE